MTYCIAASIDEGLILVSDSRTNAGIDNVSTHGKMHPFSTAADRKIVLLCAGNLATTQAVLEQLHRDIIKSAPINLNTVECLSEAADYLGHVSVEKQHHHITPEGQSAFNPSATFIIGGQIGSEPHGAYMVYAEGNSITHSANTPFLQIGENKYGKPVLDRAVGALTSLEEGARLLLVSLDATARSNVTVGPPFEVAIYRRDDMSMRHHLKLAANDPYLTQLQQRWNEGLRNTLHSLPAFAWEQESPQGAE